MAVTSTLRLTLIGTPGAGKSTIANLLCGRPILPMAVRGRSDRAFLLRHAGNDRLVHIRGADGGELVFATSSAARDFLQATDLETTVSGRTIADTKLIVTVSMLSGPLKPMTKLWVRRVIKSLFASPINLLATTTRAPLEVLDLPGIRSDPAARIAGLDNGKATCLLILVVNAEEVDHRSEQAILTELYARCRDGGMSGMLIVLNRVDVYLRHDDAPRVTEKRLDPLRQWQHRFAEVPGIHAVEIVAMSSMPLLAAEALYWHDDDLSAADRRYLLVQSSWYSDVLLPREARGAFPRHGEDWRVHHIQRFRSAIADIAGYTTFIRAIAAMIDRSQASANPTGWPAQTPSGSRPEHITIP